MQCIITPCIIIFILPVVCVVSLWSPVFTRLFLRRHAGRVDGVVIRRSGCCTWYIPVDMATSIALEDYGENSEAPPKVFLHARIPPRTGAAKILLATGSIPDLEAAVNPWIRSEELAAARDAVDQDPQAADAPVGGTSSMAKF
jgi:hypothetical protein